MSSKAFETGDQVRVRKNEFIVDPKTEAER